ncbi:hypothetical protein BB560_001821 [Smittium megazygosporum]|uniref:C2H2-type domain-containing protein n=1 Tax=Smittium megazygosporum TaxID=133381 RepID=A0A2T9ZGK0_9FUNG|nr:hypothetical protein BB560_001821 [Smittium megazygosporum]
MTSATIGSHNSSIFSVASSPSSQAESTFSEDEYCDEFFYPRNVEQAMLHNFKCCGLQLGDLHDLLQHYEECHVTFDDDNQLPAICKLALYARWGSANSSVSYFCDPPASFSLSDPAFLVESEPDFVECISPDQIQASQAINNTISSELESSFPENIASFPTPSSSTLLEDISSDSDLTRTNSIADFSKLENVYRSIESDLASSLRKFGQTNSSIGKSNIFSLNFSESSASTSVSNSPTVTPQLGSISNVLPNFSLDFENIIAETTDSSSVLPPSIQINSEMYKDSQSLFPTSNTKLAIPNNLELTFGSSALSLYDDDIISALSNSTDPLFLVNNAALPTECKDLKKSKSSTLIKEQSQVGLDAKSKTKFKAKMGLNAFLKSKLDLSKLQSYAASFEKQNIEADSNMLGEIYSGSENGQSSKEEKPYRCLLNGCNKAYKNPNGLKYHTLHGHCDAEGSSVIKPYKCLVPNCPRTYKNMNGLKYHVLHAHNAETFVDFTKAREMIDLN